jgi:hypothetical protein
MLNRLPQVLIFAKLDLQIEYNHIQINEGNE